MAAPCPSGWSTNPKADLDGMKPADSVNEQTQVRQTGQELEPLADEDDHGDNRDNVGHVDSRDNR